MREIPLTDGKFAIVDDKDFEWLSRWDWFVKKDSRTYYARRQSSRTLGKPLTISMHALILGKIPGYQIDHINGDGLDNRRCNLRHVTHRQNCQNIHTPKYSKYPGVTWSKNKQKWQADMWVNKRKTTLGRFKNEHDAFMAYYKAIKENNESTDLLETYL
jgi:hypothetical protein